MLQILHFGPIPLVSWLNGFLFLRVSGASYLVEAALVCYSSGMVTEWGPADEYDEVEAASLMPDHPTVWTDGSFRS